MNILIITQMYSQPDDEGDNKPTKTVNYFAKEWVAGGHNVVVMHCPSKFPLVLYMMPKWLKEKFAGKISTMVPPIESRKEIEREENGVRIYRFPMLKIFPGQAYSKMRMKKQTKKIEKVLAKIGYRPDVVIGHFANPSLEIVANISEDYNVKSSIVFHQDCTEKNIVRYRIKENVDRIGVVGARSIVEAKQVEKSLNLKQIPFVCCSGAPNDAVQSAEKYCLKHDFSKGVKYIYVGSMIKRKHLDAVIEGFLEVAGKDDTFNIVGGGPEADNYKKIVSDRNAEDKVAFMGRISRADVLQNMKEAHIFTLISDGEAYGMVYIEAMLQGCLVIASKGGGFDGIIQDGVNGFICEPGNKDMLVSIYRHILNMTTEERNLIGQRAIDTAKNYSEKEVAERYLHDVLNQ